MGVAIAGISPAAAADVQEQFTFTASDGVELRATVTGTDSLEPRPTLVEFSPYGRNSGTLAVGSDYNRLLVQIRGTGDSDGQTKCSASPRRAISAPSRRDFHDAGDEQKPCR